MSRASGRSPAADWLIPLARRAAAQPVRLWQLAPAALAGNLLLHQLPGLPAPLLSLLLALAALAMSAAAGSRVAALPAVAVLAFCVTAETARDRLATRWPAAASGLDLELTGWIDELPRQEAGRSVLSLRVTGVEAGAGTVPRRLRLSWYDPAPPLAAGQTLAIEARLRSPRGLVNPGGFDYERWLFLEAYDATGYVRRGEVLAGEAPGLAQRWLGFRAALIGRLGSRIADPDARALVLALALGEYVGFEDRHWLAMQRTGTSHLVSVSGLHIAIVAGLAFWLLLRLALRLPACIARHAHSLAALLCLLPASLYAALAGFALPTRRALVMLLVAELLIVVRRRWPLGGALSLALLAVLALDPLASLTASFWLSFGAVGLLLVAALGAGAAGGRIGAAPAAAGGGAGEVPGLARATAMLREFGRVQWALTLGLIPLGLWYFGQFSVASFIVNFVAIPLFSLLVVPLCLVAALLAALGVHDPWLTPLTAEIARLSWDAIEIAATLPLAALSLPKPPLAEVLLGSAAIVLALPWHPLPGRRLALFGLLPLFWPDGERLPDGEARLTVLDVGQGLAVAIETRRHRALYDTGPLYRSGFDAGAEIVGPALEALGTRRLDRLIVSHGDADHAGGLDAILARYPEALLLAGPDLKHPAAQPCRAGERWTWDGVDFATLHPPAGFGPEGNETSCVLRIATPQASALLTGDIERRAEALLAGQGGIAADVVVVPHHGSRTSSGPRFVAAVRPRVAVVSAGHDNRWGFPLPEVSERWTAAGASLLTTGDTGAVRIRLGPDGVEVRAERDRRHRYWQAEREAVSGAAGVSAL